MLVLIWPAYLLAQFMSVLVTRRGPAPGDGPDGAEAHSTSGDEKPETHSKGEAASPQEKQPHLYLSDGTKDTR